MSHVEHPITVGVIEHQAAECPALHKEHADKVVPALEAAAENGQIPGSLVFASKSHKGAFAAEGTIAEVEGAMPELPGHEARFYDATGDEQVHVLVHDASGLKADDAERHAFIDHVEQQYGESFPNRHDGPVVPGAELAGFIASKHE